MSDTNTEEQKLGITEIEAGYLQEQNDANGEDFDVPGIPEQSNGETEDSDTTDSNDSQNSENDDSKTSTENSDDQNKDSESEDDQTDSEDDNTDKDITDDELDIDTSNWPEKQRKDYEKYLKAKGRQNKKWQTLEERNNEIKQQREQLLQQQQQLQQVLQRQQAEQQRMQNPDVWEQYAKTLEDEGNLDRAKEAKTHAENLRRQQQQTQQMQLQNQQREHALAVTHAQLVQQFPDLANRESELFKQADAVIGRVPRNQWSPELFNFAVNQANANLTQLSRQKEIEKKEAELKKLRKQQGIHKSHGDSTGSTKPPVQSKDDIYKNYVNELEESGQL